MIAGFDLNDHFGISVNALSKTIEIELPMPEILSNSVNVYFDEADEGLIAPGASSGLYNVIQEKAERKAREYAQDTNLHNSALENAENVVLSIFQPIMSMPQFDYRVQVSFVDRYGEKIRTKTTESLDVN